MLNTPRLLRDNGLSPTAAELWLGLDGRGARPHTRFNCGQGFNGPWPRDSLHDSRLFHVERQRGQDMSEVCMDLSGASILAGESCRIAVYPY
jgi:hypothetical protein